MTAAIHQDQVADFDQNDLIALMPHMRSFALSLCRDRTEAQDLTQDALVSAWRRRDSYTPGTNLKAWVFMIVRNQFYSDKRRSWRVSQLDPKLAEETLLAVSNPSAALDLDDLRRAMAGLTEEQRQALTLVAVSGLAYNEAATCCDCAEGTIKSRVSRARQRLSMMLAQGNLTAERRAPGGAMAAILGDAERTWANVRAQAPRATEYAL